MYVNATVIVTDNQKLFGAMFPNPLPSVSQKCQTLLTHTQ